MAKLLYRDGANFKDYLERPLPSTLKTAKIGDDIDVTFLGYESAEQFIEKEFDRNYSEDYDHGLLELLELDETDFKDPAPVENHFETFANIFNPNL